MIRRELIDIAQVPGGTELRLFRRGSDYMIVLDRNELMNSRMSGSEEALAQMTLDRIASHAPRMLIGGYGMGFTLRAALARTGPAAEITVVELVSKIVEWARGPMAAITAGCLDDPRVTLAIEDVARSIARAQGGFDAILLDVDNGPDGLVRPANDQLYVSDGLKAAWDALVPDGVLAVWSAGADPAFTRRLESAGFGVEQVTVRARSNGKGPRHVIWFARKPRARLS